jgi:hypothetical protein
MYAEVVLVMFQVGRQNVGRVPRIVLNVFFVVLAIFLFTTATAVSRNNGQTAKNDTR